ncbi:substrate-binding domain-containing protein [Rhodococcus sp. ABRD24]|uniref:substrate-binding domain-containing protein n=1 Tax=Rhodococcus sp. ABRD24 TaxID=2507582 RepID=UPI001F603BDA|nr:substrate-binding domain-containing protein [Rhodococcus sp. ABRD24]
MLMADVSQPWYGGIARAVDRICDSEGYAVKIRSFSHDRQRMLAYLETVMSDGVDGIILNTGDELDDPEITAAIERVVASGVSFVLIGQRTSAVNSVDTVLYDDVHSAYEAVGHLHSVWGSKICFVGDIAGSAGATDRRLGFDRAVSELDIEDTVLRLGLDGYGAGHGYAAMSALLETANRPNGILAVNDQIALGAFRALQDHGLAAGVDVGVVGFGDVEFASYLAPSLSSVSGCVDEIANTALEMLFTRINSPVDERLESRTVVVKRALTIRESSSGTLRRI